MCFGANTLQLQFIYCALATLVTSLKLNATISYPLVLKSKTSSALSLCAVRVQKSKNSALDDKTRDRKVTAGVFNYDHWEKLVRNPCSSLFRIFKLTLCSIQVPLCRRIIEINSSSNSETLFFRDEGQAARPPCWSEYICVSIRVCLQQMDWRCWLRDTSGVSVLRDVLSDWRSLATFNENGPHPIHI